MVRAPAGRPADAVPAVCRCERQYELSVSRLAVQASTAHALSCSVPVMPGDPTPGWRSGEATLCANPLYAGRETGREDQPMDELDAAARSIIRDARDEVRVAPRQRDARRHR